MEINQLDWDSLNFGFKVGLYKVDLTDKFSLDKLTEKARKEGFRLIYISSPHKINDTSLFYDEKLVYSKENENIKECDICDIVSYTSQDIESDIYDLAIGSGKYSRYRLDKKFPVDKFYLLYRKWIENSVLTDYATDVLIYRMEGKAVGLLTYKNEGDNSNIGIIAVNPAFQGCGIGHKLMKHYQSQLGDNIKTLDVVTQGVNEVAKTFYEKNGYTITSRTYIYHLWI